MSGQKSVVVVGAGIVGLCVAYSLVRRGHSVTVVDRGGREGDRCSLGNAGFVVPSHFVPLAAPGMVGMGLRMLFNPEGPFSIRPSLDPKLLRWAWLFARSSTGPHVELSAPLLRDLNLASRARYMSMARELSTPFGFNPCGLLMLCRSDKALREEGHVAAMACKLGVPASVLSAKETAALEPEVAMDVAGAVRFPMDCALDPGRLVDSLTAELENAGVRFEWNREVTGWRVSGERIEAVKTADGDVEGDEFVVAAGTWSSKLVRMLGQSLPMQSGKGYSITLTKPRQMLRHCAILTEARVAITPMGDKMRFGGTMEVVDEDLSVNRRRAAGIVKSVLKYLPQFDAADFEGIDVWSGLRPCSPDGLPYIGRFRGMSNLTAASGHAMMGVSLAPVTGEIVGDIIAGEKPPYDMGMLSPDRFG